MSISTPFISCRIATSSLMAAILLAGIAAYPMLLVAPLPNVEFPTINVTAKFPGASPETMATSVAQPLEYQFAQISGISEMTSVSVLGQSQVTIQFELNRSIDFGGASTEQSALTGAQGQSPKKTCPHRPPSGR